MTVSIGKFVEDDISGLSDRLGYSMCWFYSLTWVTDFEKFLNTLFKSNKSLFVVLPASRDDKDRLEAIIRNIAHNNNASVMILYSERLSSKNFIVCNKSSGK